MNYSSNNHLILLGKIVSEKTYSHEIYGEKFYIFNLEVIRLSSTTDIIPITISERLLTDLDISIGKEVKVEGQFRSYNSMDNGKNRLILTVFAKEIENAIKTDEDEDKENITNEVTLIGYICKKPIYRQTPFGREIADVLLAVNRAYNKSDYIPCIAWGRNARYCKNIDVGTEVKITGRVQSRIYEKKHEDGSVESKVAYEVSIASMEVPEKEADSESDNEVKEEVI
ncbi:MAG: single-stranded DNA-binding protein [Clostridia bacterium]|nr:single-stranded DNA-binding protein [Clostridia bacterium]